MLPRINGKELFDCTEDDFCEIIDNLDYRENEYLDYKKTLDILSIPKDRINEPELFTPSPGNRLNTGKTLIKSKNGHSPKR